MKIMSNPKLLIPLALLVIVLIAAALLLLSRRTAPRPILTPGLTAEPLPVTGSPGATLMTPLTPAQTGINFINQLSPENQIKYTYNGAGVAVGDFDGDGLIDIFLCNQEGQSKLYRNKGNMQFEDVTEAAGLSQVTAQGGFAIGAYFADIDNDGDLDLFITNWKVSNRLFENLGNGKFRDITAAAGVIYAGGSTTATFADYDRDGHLDFYVTNYRPNAIEMETTSLRLQQSADGQLLVPPELQDRITLVQGEGGRISIRELGERDLLYRNNGDGTFSEVAAAAGISGNYWGLSATFTDIDGDGWPDLYVTNDLWSPDTFYLNNGDGTFTLIDPMMLQHTPHFSMGIDFGDINNDGLMDYFIGDMISRDHTLRLTQHGEMDMSPSPPGFAPQFMRNSLYLNNGDGSFSDIAWIADVAASEWTWSVKFADLDLDGYLDLFITNGMVRDLMDSDAFYEAKRIQETQGIEAFMAYLQQYPLLNNPNVVFRNNGDLSFTEVAAQWGLATEKVGHGASLADLDNDGDLDIVVNYMNDTVGIYQNNAAASRIMVQLVGQSSNSQGIGANITLTTDNGIQTRHVTASGGYLSNHQPAAVFGLGAAGLIRELRVEWPSGHVQTFPDSTSGPLQANMLYTIVEPAEKLSLNPSQPLAPTNPQFREVGQQVGLTGSHWESSFDDFAQQMLLPRRLSTLGPGIAWGDFNEDGLVDFYMAGARGQSGLLYQNQGNERFVPVTTGSTVTEEEMAPLWWYSGQDSRPSLLLSYSSVESGQSPYPIAARLTPNDTGFLAPDGSWQLLSTSSGGPMAAADFDGDGDVDLFVGGRVIPGQWPLAASSRLLRNDGGQMVDVTDQAAPGLNNIGLVTAAIWLDVDNDGDPDLLLATEWGPIHLFRNEGGFLIPSTQEAGLQPWLGLWTGLTAGDFNQDGFMDFAAANLGLNTPYRASLDSPLILYAGDVDNNGSWDLIETIWVDGVLRPMRERGMVGKAIPFVLEAFPTFRSYAEASINDIYGERLAGVGAYAAATLEHTIFLNNGSGQFTATPLPLIAQTTAGYGITTADFDNDGIDDLYLVGNFHGADHEIMAYSGGVSYWLRGNGNGTFTPVAAAQSGLFVPYEARGLAVADYNNDGWIDVAVGLNNHAPLLFRNGGVPGHNSLRIQLIGPAGNPTGVGARITITLPDGSTTSREIHAGNGYLSQDSPIQVFGLGRSSQAEITVRWPDGHITTLSGTAGQMVMVPR